MNDRNEEPVNRTYVLVCKGESCSKEGSPERIKMALKQAVREFPAKSVKVSFVSCLGMCGEGPNVVVCSGGKAFHRCASVPVDEILAELRGRSGRPGT